MITKTRIGIILGIYFLLMVFLSTEWNPLLLLVSYQEFINAIPPQIFLTNFFVALTGGLVTQALLKQHDQSSKQL